MDVVNSGQNNLSAMPPIVLVTPAVLADQLAISRAELQPSHTHSELPTASPQGDVVLKSPADDLPGGHITTIGPQRGWKTIDVQELFAYRDLYRFLVRREIKIRYAQSAIGVGWAVLQPLFTMLIFTVVFGRMARVSSDGLPYALFSFAGLIPWMYFSNSVTDGVGSLIGNAHMLSKVYFPRLLLPLAAVTARLVDFAVASIVLTGMMLWYGIVPNWGVIALPWILGVMLLTAVAVALWLGALAIQYRDIKHAMNFIVQLLMYAAPVVYPISMIPSRFHPLLALNPMVGVIEALRSVLLGTQPMPWLLMCIATMSATMMLVSGMLYFNHKQRSFADVA